MKGASSIVNRVGVARKMFSSILMAVILSIVLVRFHGYAPFSIYFLYCVFGCLFIGLPCSVISDIIVLRIKGTIFGVLLGLTFHLIFAGIIVYLFSINEPVKYARSLVYSVFVAAAGLWLIDSILKKIKVLK